MIAQKPFAENSRFRPNAERWRAFQDRFRDPALRAILALELVVVFLAAPLAVKGMPLAEEVLRVCMWVALTLIVLLSDRWLPVFLLAVAIALMSSVLWPGQGWQPAIPAALSDAGGILGFSVLTWLVAHSVWAPGPITAHRIQGAVVAYLNLALIFASAYRLIWELNPAAFNNLVAAADQGLPLGNALYFSLTTLTTTGYGDITPLDPFARALAKLEAVIGQFYLAIVVARLIALQLAERRSE